MCARFWCGNLSERVHWGDQNVDGRIILRWILMDGFGSGQGQVAGTCEYGNELLGSIKCGEFLD